MLTEESLTSAGYRKYVQRPETIRKACYLLQKRFRDERGTRYFITVYVYDWRDLKAPRAGGLSEDFGFSPSAQFGEEAISPTVDITLHEDAETTVEFMERFFEQMWEHLGRPYYERED